MKTFCFAAAILFSSTILAQQISGPCIDSLRIPNTYAPCGTEYQPVCGCDQVTYRNECAAFEWGGLTGGSWTTNTVCGYFDFDFYPTAVTYFPAQFSLYMKEKGSAVLYIFDAFGRIEFTQYFYASYPGQIQSREIGVQNFLQGIYCAVVVVGGDKQFKKFAKVGVFD